MHFKKKLLSLAFLAYGQYAHAVTSKTFFQPRTLCNDATLELTLTNYRLFHNTYSDKPYSKPKQRAMFAMQSTYYFQETDSAHGLARYFLLGNKSELSVKEDGSGDIGSEWVKLHTADNNYSAKFTLRPQRSVYGSIWNFSLDFSEILDGLWMQLLMPMVRAEQKTHIRQFDNPQEGISTDLEGNPIRTIKEAFNVPEMLYGKIHSSKVTTFGMDDVQLKIGYNALFTDTYHLALYVNMLIPMGSEPNAVYMFEPIVGGTHFGAGVGLNFDYKVMKVGKHEINILSDFKYRYMFAADETRTVDLKPNGQWSRYLSLAKANNPSGRLIGTNFLTGSLRVEPKNTIDWWTAVHYKYCQLHVELGYDLWWRDKENITLRKPWPTYTENLGIFDISREGTGNETSSSMANISESALDSSANQAPSDGAFVRITNNNINLSSAAHDSALSQKIFLGLSYNALFLGQPSLFGVGATYEFGSRNTAANQWAVFAKTGFNF